MYPYKFNGVIRGLSTERYAGSIFRVMLHDEMIDFREIELTENLFSEIEVN